MIGRAGIATAVVVALLPLGWGCEADFELPPAREVSTTEQALTQTTALSPSADSYVHMISPVSTPTAAQTRPAPT